MSGLFSFPENLLLAILLLLFRLIIRVAESFMENLEDVKFEEAPAGKTPMCPYCRNPLNVIWFKTTTIALRGQETLLMCPHCEAFLDFNCWK